MVIEERRFFDIRVDSVADYGSNLNAVIHVMKGTIVMLESKSGRGSLFAGGAAAILASACCLGPLVLITLGISGAWIGNLAALEPYRPWFIGTALVAMVFAWRQIYRPVEACQPGEICAIPQVRTSYKVVFWIVALLILTALAFPFVLPLFY
jgi:mercuric ion transport protein